MAETNNSTPGSVDFVETAARHHAAYCREQAAHFRSMAETETLPALRRHLTGLARQYDELADAADACSDTPGPSSQV